MSAPDAMILIDEVSVPFAAGQTILEAALSAGVYIPHLCHHPEFEPHGSCKVCTVVVNGRNASACTMRAAAGQEVEVDTPDLHAYRRTLVQMLFVEGNHFCPGCEKSGNCQLQALAYDSEMMTPHFVEFYPDRPVDASHPDVLLDFNRCIQCELCVRASRDIDGKSVFALSGRGMASHIIVNSPTGKARRHELLGRRQGRARVSRRRHSDQARRLFDADRRAPLRPRADQRGSDALRGGGREVSGPAESPALPKVRLATTSLAGCFGCHMSLLDIDERILELAKIAEFDRSPLTDIKHCGPCDIALIEGGVCNAENVHVLRELRANSKILVAVGACAINGGLPAMRNRLDVGDILNEVYRDADGVRSHVPSDPELPLLFDKVYPINEIVRVDYFIPGCPPSADALWKYLNDLILGRMPRLDHELLHYD